MANPAERLANYLKRNINDKQVLYVPEGDFVRWLPKNLYSLEIEELSLRFMKLLTFPVGGAGLGSLVYLRYLNLTANDLKKLPSSFQYCSNLAELNLSFNCFTKFPPAVCHLKQLCMLDISNNDIKSIDSNIAQLTNLRYFDASYNLLTSVPDELEHCMKLEFLNLAGKWYPLERLSCFSVSVCKLSNLTHLDLSWNVIDTIPDDIRTLSQLTTLNLKGNMLKKVSPEIRNCSTLQTLKLTGAMKLVYAVPEEFFTLRNVVVLELSDNYFTDIPPDVSKLEKLESLVMVRNSLVRIPAELFSVRKLRELNLSENYIQEIPREIGRAKHLQILDLAQNRLQTLPDTIVQCSSLQKIMLENNSIQSVPKKMYKLVKLNYLDLSNNQLKKLPLLLDRLRDLQSSGYLYLHGNTLSQPPQEICDQGAANLFVYLKELRISESTHRQKLILIGAVKAGKTSLRNALILEKSKLTAEHERTWVMERHLWEPEEMFRVQVLDFGGHQIYSAAHQMFLTPEAVHVVVVDFSIYTEDKYDELVGDWIEAIVERAPGAVIKLVGTHADLIDDTHISMVCEGILTRMHEEEKINIDVMRADLDQWNKILETPEARNSASGKFPNPEVDRLQNKCARLQRIINTRVKLPTMIDVVSCAEGLEGVSKLRSSLVQQFKQMDAKVLPQSWQKLLLCLQSRTEKILTWSEVTEVFSGIMKLSQQAVGSSIEKDLAMILKYLHKTGELVWFHDNLKLQNIIFHHPETLIEMLRSIFRHDFDSHVTFDDSYGHRLGMTEHKFNIAKREFLHHGMMSYELMQYSLLHFHLSSDAIDTFISLMLKFDLCYEVPRTLSSTRLLAAKRILNFPWFLSTDSPENLSKLWPDKCSIDNVELRMIVQFRHRGPQNFFEKLSVRLQAHVFDRVDWKDGILAHKNKTQIFVRREKIDKHYRIVLSVRGADLQEMWSLVLLPLADITDILSEWPCTRVDFSSVCPHCIIRHLDDPHIYPGEVFEAKCPRGVYTLRCCDNEPDVDIPTCFIYSLDSDFEEDLDKHFKTVTEFLQTNETRDKYWILTDMGIYYVASQLGFEWTTVAIGLGLNQPRIDQATSSHPHNTFQQIVTALIFWRDEITNATADKDQQSTDKHIENLLEALIKADRLDLAEDLRDRYNIEQ